MQLSARQELPTSQKNAWDALNNTDVLQKCIAGCESLTEVAPHQYEILIIAAVGPVKAKFKGKLRISDLSPPTSYRIEFEGQGGAAGHGKGSANVRLEPASDDRCELVYEANASVGGKIAQIGQRLVDVAAQKMAGEFFAAFEKQLGVLYPSAAFETAAAPAPSPTHSLWTAIVEFFRRHFGKRRSA
jgi:uncharacterized protein